MPRYEINGQLFDFDSVPSEEDIDEIASKYPAKVVTPVSAPVKTDWMQDIGIGAENLAHVGKDALDMLAAPLARRFGANEDADAIYADMVKRKQAREEEMKGYDQGTSGKVISGLTGIAPAVALAPIVGPAAAMGGMAGMSALSSGATNVMDGASGEQAVRQATGEGVMDTLANLLPGGRGVLKGIGLGVGGNVASQAGADALAQSTMQGTEALDKNYHVGMDKETAEKYLVSGVTGALPGAVIGKMGATAEANTPRTTTPPPPNVANTRLPLETQDQATKDNIQRSNTARDIITIKLDEAQISLERTKETLANLANRSDLNTKQEEALAKAQERLPEQQGRVLKLREELKLHEDTLARYAPPPVDPNIAPVAGQQPPVDVPVPPRPVEPAVEPVQAPMESPGAPRVSNIDDFATSASSLLESLNIPRTPEEVTRQQEVDNVDNALEAQVVANQSAPPLTPPAPIPNPPQPSAVRTTAPQPIAGGTGTPTPNVPPTAGVPPLQAPRQPTPATIVRGAPVTVEYDITKPMSLNAIRDAIVNGVWKDPKGFANNILSKIQAGYFGSQQAMLGLKDKYPLAFQAYIQTNLANHVAERYRRSWLYDLNPSNIHQGAVGKGLMKVFMNLKESTNPDSVHNLLKKGKDTTANLVEILKMAQEARAQGITHSQHMAANQGRLTPHQVKMYTALEKMWNRMQQDAGTPYIAGWFPAVRHGDFGTWIKDQFGTPFRFETFKTALERDQFAAKYATSGTGFAAEFVNKKDSPALYEQLSLVNDMLGRNLTPDKKQALDTIEKVRQAMAGNAGLGSHALHRRDYAGFEGNKLGKTELQNAEDWHQAIFDSVDDFAVQWKKRHLTKVAEAFIKDPAMKQAAPQQVEMAEAVFNNAMRITKEGSISEKIEDVGDSINHIANTSLVKLQQALFKDPDLKASRRDVIHNAVSYPARLFYLNILMKRPAFWISTVLTSPMAVSRQLFRDGKPMETMKAVASGTFSMMHGMSTEKRKFMREVANESEIFGHSLTLETQNAGGVDMSKYLKKDTLDMIDGVGWITGSTPAKKAEALSRLWAASIGYEYYKDKFPRNRGALKLQVEHFVATTMVLYGAEHSSPLLQKAGVLGQAAGQLTKYPTAQLGNLIADFQHIKKSEYKTYLPIVSTLLGSMIAGGTAGTALVAEYEILASIFNKMAEFLGLDVKAPSAVRAMYENTNPVQSTLAKGYGWLGADEDRALKMSQLGVPSGLTGMDVGSGLRTQSYLSKLVTDPTSGIFDAMPAVSWAKDQIAGVGTMLNSKSNEAEKRKAMMDAGIPVIGSKAIIDRFGFNAGDRQFVPDNKTGAGLVEQTIKEEVANALGTRTTSTAIETGRGFLETTQLRADKDKQKQSIELVVDDILAGREMRLDAAIEAYMKTSGSGEDVSDAIRSAVENSLRKRYMDQASRFKYGIDDNISTEDMIKTLRYEKVEE